MSLLEEAIKYSERGWYVFPCRENPHFYINKDGEESVSKEKSPYTMNGHKDASIDKEVIEKFWSQYPNALIGCDAGRSGLFVVDIDVKSVDGIGNWMNMNVPDSGALHSMTPSNGIHIIFRGCGKTTTSKVSGIDTRSEGGYFILPPSEVISGTYLGKYVQMDDWDREPMYVPSDLISKLNVSKEKQHKKINNSNKPVDVNKVIEAVAKLPEYMADNYSDWITIGMALANLGEQGFEIWDNFSKKSSKYKSSEIRSKWKTFHPNEITVGSIFYHARQENENA